LYARISVLIASPTAFRSDVLKLDASAGGAAKTVGHRSSDEAFSEKHMAPTPCKPSMFQL
jgi:hypothetical protein